MKYLLAIPAIAPDEFEPKLRECVEKIRVTVNALPVGFPPTARSALRTSCAGTQFDEDFIGKVLAVVGATFEAVAESNPATASHLSTSEIAKSPAMIEWVSLNVEVQLLLSLAIAAHGSEWTFILARNTLEAIKLIDLRTTTSSYENFCRSLWATLDCEVRATCFLTYSALALASPSARL